MFPAISAGVGTSFTYDDDVNKVTAVVSLKGSVDIMVSPLMLEALQRYFMSIWTFKTESTDSSFQTLFFVIYMINCWPNICIGPTVTVIYKSKKLCRAL